MEESKTQIIGIPIYWWELTAILKAFIDRWYRYNITGQFFREKSIILLVASGGGSESYSRHIAGMMEDITKYVRINIEEKISCMGIGRRGDVEIDNKY